MPLPAPIKILAWMAAPILTGGTSRAAAVTLGLAPIRDGTVARTLETSAPVIRVLAPVRAGIPVPTRDRARASARARMRAAIRVAVPVHARATFRTPAW